MNNTTLVFNIDKTVKNASVMFSAGVVANVLALILMLTSPKEQKRTHFFKLMAGLAVTDLFGTLSVSPVVITVYVEGIKLQTDHPLCKYFAFMFIFAAFSRMLFVLSMAVERYVCVCHPIIYKGKFPKSYARYTFIISWIFSVFISSLPLMGLGEITPQFPNTWCLYNVTTRVFKDMAFNYLYALLSLAVIVGTFVCNVAAVIAVLTLRKRQRALAASQGTNRNRSVSQRIAELHMIIMLLGVTICFTVCLGPLVIFTIMCQTDLVQDLNVPMLYILCVRVASYNPIIDPWVYILVRRELRWKIISLFKKIFFFRSTICASPDSDEKQEDEAICPSTPTHPESLLERRRSRFDVEAEMSFWTFCFHCFCDPPVHRTSSTVIVNSSRRCSQTPSVALNRASFDGRRVSGASGKFLIQPPTPSEEVILQKISSQSKFAISPDVLNESNK